MKGSTLKPEKMSVKEAVLHHKLDRRSNWFSFCGELVRNFNYTRTCTGCCRIGCAECGYHGKSRSCCPEQAIDKNGFVIEVSDPDFTYFKNLQP